MLRFIILLVSSAIFSHVNAQNFIKKYHFGLQGLIFSDVLIDHNPENIILYGYGVDTSQNNGYGFFIARLDTMGNLVAYDVHYLPNNEVFGYTPNRDFILDANGGYVATGNSLTNNAGALVKINSDLSLNFISQFPLPDDEYLYDVQYIQPTPDGFFLGGSVGFLTEGLQPVIYKVDADGNLIWTKYYTDNTSTSNFLTDVIKLSDSEYVLAGDSYPWDIDVTDYKYLGWMIGIDTSGNELWTWHNDTSQYEFGLTELLKVSDDGWVAINSKVEWGPGNNVKGYSGILRLNEEKEFVWDPALGTGQPYFNYNSGLHDLAQTIDSNWVAVGELIVDSLNARVAWMVAVTPDGDSLWARTDTLQHVTGTPYRSGLHGLVVLPSGSIIAAGRTQHPNGRYYGLLIKTDPRGCIEPDCHPYMSILDATDNADDFNFELSPNPTSGLLRVTCPGVTPFSAEVYDGTGRVLAAHSAMRCGDTLDVAHLPSGQYFIRVQSEGSASVVHSVIRL